MKAICLSTAALLLIAFVSGCSENPVRDYGTGLVETYKSTEKEADAANLAVAQRTVEAFRAANGRYPESLEELKSFSTIALDPSVYDYDPATGRISPR
jgi:hypothetical protein